MSVRPEEIIGRARELVGTPFRPQGRDPGIGIDCIGLALLAFGVPCTKVRRNYRLAGDHFEEIGARLSELFDPVKGEMRAGDLLLCATRPRQAHLAIHCGESFIHADARLRRVVEAPGPPSWPVVRVFRVNDSNPSTS